MNIVEFLDKVKPIAGYRVTGQFIDFYFKDEIATHIKDPNGKIETDPFYYNTLIAPVHHKFIPRIIRRAASTAGQMPYIRAGWIHTIAVPADLSTQEFNDLTDYVPYGTPYKHAVLDSYIELCQVSNFIFDIISDLQGNITCIHAIGYDTEGFTEVLFSFDLEMFWIINDDQNYKLKAAFERFQDNTKFDIYTVLDEVYRFEGVCRDLSAANRAVPNQNN